MKNKIIALVAMFGISFSTFAQVNVPVSSNITLTELTTDPPSQDGTESNNTSTTEIKTEKEESKVMAFAKSSSRKKSWDDRSLAGKILLIAAGVVFVGLCILLPNGYNSRTGI